MDIINMLFTLLLKVVCTFLNGGDIPFQNLNFYFEQFDSFFTGTSYVYNIFAWANALLPVNLMLFILTVTAAFYLTKFAVAVIRFILGRI